MIWAYPTSTAKVPHAFPAEGEPSLCRRYSLTMISLATIVPAEQVGTACAVCTRKAPNVSEG